MKTSVKTRILSFLLTIMMMVSVVPMSGMITKASAVGADAVKNTINSIKSEYPNKSYFSKNGKRCEHGSIFAAYADNTTCYNCELHTILKSKGISTNNYSNGRTCYAFASYCFTKCFGKPMTSSNYTEVASANLSGSTSGREKYDFFKKAKMGDILRTSGHYMVFISCDSEGVTVYDSNVGGIYYCIQGHKRCTAHKKNGNIGDQSKGGYTGSVRYGKMNYSSVKYESIKIWHAKNYDSTSGSSSSSSFNFNTVGVDSVTETNANIYATFDKQNINGAGFYFGTSSSSLKKISKSLNGNVDGAGSFAKINYPMNKWYGTLSPKTTYYYKLYVVKNGKEYQTEVKSFTTKTPFLTIKFNANGGAIESDRFKLVSNMVYDGGKLLESKWEYDKTQPYGLWNDSSFGLYRKGYTFVGWGTAASGGKIFDQDDATVKPSDMSPNIKNGSCSITLYAIWKPVAEKVTPKLDKNSVSLKYKDSDTISVTNGVKVTWESTNPTVACVDNYGNITANKQGSATIIAVSADGTKAECKVNVRMEWWQSLLKIISFGIY